MPQGEMPVCYTCLRFWKLSHDTIKCDAYPNGIPISISMSGDLHNEKVPGDHGLQYEKGTPQDRE